MGQRTTTPAHVVLARALAALGLLGVFDGCSDSTSDKIKAASLSEGCVLNTDCEAPLVCAFRRCHNECTTSRDCSEGQRCVASDRPFRVCQLEVETACTRNSECPRLMICAVDGECRDQCVTNRDCVAGQVCAGGSCAEPEELDESGNLPPAPASADDPDPGAPPCFYNSDCAAPEVCRSGGCVVQCVADRDCAPGYRCSDSACVATSGPLVDSGAPTAACVFNSDCTPAGEVCVAGACRCQCREDRDCALGFSCDGCGCVSAGGPSTDGGAGGASCVYNSDCSGAGEVCVGGDCRCQCRADRDCASGTTCDGCGCQAAVSPDAGGGGCFYSSDCSVAGQICVAGTCRCECQADRDCGDGERCDGCACVLDTPDGAPPTYGAGCALNSDCTAPLVCIQGSCTYECRVDGDCSALGTCCFNHTCVTGPVCEPPPAGDGGPDPGALDGGGPCVACSSNYDCQDALWCNGTERCFAGCCAPALDTPCNSNSACIEDICDEVNRTCAQITKAGEDVDGDGHLSFGCVGGDDCDDDDPTSYTGAPELCDGLDNDCDGLTDDGSRVPYGTTQSGGGKANIEGGYGVCLSARGGDTLFHFCGGNQPGTTPYNYGVSAATRELGTNAILTDAKRIFSTGASDNDTYLLDVAAESGGSALVIFKNVSGTYVMRAIVVDSALNVQASLALTGTSSVSSFGDADATWAGSAYFAGWVGYSGVGNQGNVAFITKTGQVQSGAVVPTTDGTGSILGGTKRIRVADNGIAQAALYRDGGVPSVALFESGLVTAGPIALPAGGTTEVHAIAGTPGGFIAVWSDDGGGKYSFVQNDGTLVSTTPLPGNGAGLIDGDGHTDGSGAFFGFDYNGVAKFGYVRPGIPFELSTAIAAGGNSDSAVALSGSNGAYAIGYYKDGSGGTVPYIKPVGCIPTP